MAGKEKRLRNLLNLYLRYPIIAGIVFAVMNIMVYVSGRESLFQ